MSSNNKILRNYVSEIDLFLQQFDKEHPEKSASQKKEIKKAKRVSRLRDNPETENKNASLWEGF